MEQFTQKISLGHQYQIFPPKIIVFNENGPWITICLVIFQNDPMDFQILPYNEYVHCSHF